MVYTSTNTHCYLLLYYNINIFSIHLKKICIFAHSKLLKLYKIHNRFHKKYIHSGNNLLSFFFVYFDIYNRCMLKRKYPFTNNDWLKHLFSYLIEITQNFCNNIVVFKLIAIVVFKLIAMFIFRLYTFSVISGKSQR